MRKYVNLYFTTWTLLNWHPLFQDDLYKSIIIDSFRFTVKSKCATIWAFVIMPDHVHLVWQILEPYTVSKVQQSILRFTSKKIKETLQKESKNYTLERFKVNKSDREYQFWQRASMSIEIYSDKVLMQKINYIHNNPIRKDLNSNYKYSSSQYFETGIKNWDFLFSWDDE